MSAPPFALLADEPARRHLRSFVTAFLDRCVRPGVASGDLAALSPEEGLRMGSGSDAWLSDVIAVRRELAGAFEASRNELLVELAAASPLPLRHRPPSVSEIEGGYAPLIERAAAGDVDALRLELGVMLVRVDPERGIRELDAVIDRGVDPRTRVRAGLAQLSAELDRFGPTESPQYDETRAGGMRALVLVERLGSQLGLAGAPGLSYAVHLAEAVVSESMAMSRRGQSALRLMRVERERAGQVPTFDNERSSPVGAVVVEAFLHARGDRTDDAIRLLEQVVESATGGAPARAMGRMLGAGALAHHLGRDDLRRTLDALPHATKESVVHPEPIGAAALGGWAAAAAIAPAPGLALSSAVHRTGLDRTR